MDRKVECPVCAGSGVIIGARFLSRIERDCPRCGGEGVVMRMAEVYREPTLTADYCAKVCPIGQVLAHSLNRSEFAVTVLRLLKEFTDVEHLRDSLIHIASDGRVNPHEVDEFKEIIREMVELERQIGELKFFALRHGVEIEEIMPAAAV